MQVDQLLPNHGSGLKEPEERRQLPPQKVFPNLGNPLQALVEQQLSQHQYQEVQLRILEHHKLLPAHGNPTMPQIIIIIT
jgi:hypothetical protein